MIALRSLRARIFLLTLVIGLVPCIAMRHGIVSNYEDLAVEQRVQRHLLGQEVEALVPQVLLLGGIRLARLLHERLINTQTAGGIDDHRVVHFLPRVFNRVARHLHRVAGGLPGADTASPPADCTPFSGAYTGTPAPMKRVPRSWALKRP